MSDGKTLPTKDGLPNKNGHVAKQVGDEGAWRLTDKQELYCKLRAEGFNKSSAAKQAFVGCEYPAQVGYNTEQEPHIQERIKQIREERAWSAKLVDPQESLARWNEIYHEARAAKDTKTVIEAQKQIDKINGAEASVVRQQLEVKGLFRGETDEEWKSNAKRLMEMLGNTIDTDKVN